jgi:hypothetical protein
MRPSIHRTLVLLMSGIALATTVRAEDDAQALLRLKAEITQVVGDGRCGNVSFCRILPMGYDACGNPTAWIAFNNAPDIKEILETKASEVTFVEEDRMRGKPRPADCKPVRAPKLACINGRCVVGDLSY